MQWQRGRGGATSQEGDKLEEGEGAWEDCERQQLDGVAGASGRGKGLGTEEREKI